MLKVVRDDTKWQLVQIQIEPAWQGQGIGTHILRMLIQDAHSQGVSLCLSVLKVNPAKRLYDRLGFRVVADKQHAYAMQLDL